MFLDSCKHWALHSFYPTLISKRVATIKSIFHEYKNEEFSQFVSSWHFCSLIFERGNVAYWATDRWGNQFQRGFRLDLNHNLLFFNLFVSQILHVRNEDRVWHCIKTIFIKKLQKCLLKFLPINLYLYIFFKKMLYRAKKKLIGLSSPQLSY